MKSSLEDQLATLAWGNFTQRKPGEMKLLRALLDNGFSPLLARRMINRLPDGLDYQQSLKQALSALTFNLHTIASDSIIEKGVVDALADSTGAGKVALLTTDNYLIGGYEQFRIYRQLLSIPVRNIKDTEDLQLTLPELRNKCMALIDTVGMSQRNQMVAQLIAILNNCGADVKRMLKYSCMVRTISPSCPRCRIFKRLAS